MGALGGSGCLLLRWGRPLSCLGCIVGGSRWLERRMVDLRVAKFVLVFTKVYVVSNRFVTRVVISSIPAKLQ